MKPNWSEINKDGKAMHIEVQYTHEIHSWHCFPFCIKNSEAASQSSVNGRGRLSFGVVEMFGKCVEVLEFEEI